MLTNIHEDKFDLFFKSSPFALFLVDASALATRLGTLNLVGIEDYDSYFDREPERFLDYLSELQIIDANATAVNMFEAQSKEFILSPAQLLSLGAENLFVELIKLLVGGGFSSEGRYNGNTFAGKEFTSTFHWTVLNNNEQDHSQVVLSLLDTTAQTKVEEELETAVQQLQIIQNIETGILAAKSPEAIAKIALEWLNEIVPCLSLAASLFDFDNSESVLLAGLNTQRKPGERTLITPSPIWDRLKEGQPVILNHLSVAAKHSIGLQTALDTGGQALMVVPLVVQGRTIGAINLISENDNAFSEREEEIASQISDSIAVAIHNWRLLETEQNARREADTLGEVASNINASLNKEELLEFILTQLQRVLPYDSASILQYKGENLIISAHKGLSEGALAVLDPLDPLPRNIRKLVDIQIPLIIPDTSEDPDWIFVPGAEKIRCWLGVPLIANDSFIGLLMLDKWEPYFYTAQSAKLALAFANHAAITIENARLIRETQEQSTMLERRVRMRTRDLAALYDITAVTSEFLDLQTLLDMVTSRIAVTMNCPTVTIHTFDSSQVFFQLICHKGVSPAMLEYANKLPTDHPIVKQIIESGEPQIFSNIQNDPVLADIPLRSSLTHSATAPIRSKGKILGVLGIVREREEPFSREEVALLSSIADHIGIAIENDRLQKQAAHAVVAEERERLARELHDSITQSLFSLTLFAATASELLHHEKSSEAEQYLDEIAKTANQTHREMRLLLYELRPSALAKEGLVEAIRQRIETVEQRSGIHGQVSSNLSQPLPSSIEGALFQVANEALNNTLKHAEANKVQVNIFVQEQRIRMEIKDNGVGFNINSTKRGSGLGLINMKQRMAAIGGELTCHSAIGTGTTIIAATYLRT